MSSIDGYKREIEQIERDKTRLEREMDDRDKELKDIERKISDQISAKGDVERKIHDLKDDINKLSSKQLEVERKITEEEQREAREKN